MTDELTIENVGPIRHLTVPLPEGGGVVTLTGRNGQGKTHALDATKALLSGSGSLPLRRGAIDGAVTLGTARIVVARRTSRSGELEALHLDGDIDPSVVVDPGLKDGTAADARRIVMLCRLAGVEASPEMFAHLLHGGIEELNEATKPESRTKGTLPEMASCIKRDLEAGARALEGEYENALGRASGLQQAAEGLDLTAESDGDVLAGQAEAAVVKLAETEERARGAAMLTEERAKATAEIERVEAEYAGKVPLDEARENYTEIETYYKAAQEASEEARIALTAAAGAVEAAETREKLLALAKSTIEETEGVTMPSVPELERLREGAKAARVAQENGAVVRSALDKIEKAAALTKEANELHTRGVGLRSAAKSCEDVVRAAVSKVMPEGLTIIGDRLVFSKAEGEQVHFSELSHGERYRLAIKMAADAIEEHAATDTALLVINQEAWEGLDGTHRREVHDIAREMNVTILTAESDKDEEDHDLEATVFE